MHDSKTAGIIIIGNEILSGKVHDINSYYLACELRSLGTEVRRILVIPDDIDVIGNETAKFSDEFDYVFTAGGVGPTHDDVTMAGIAAGFGVRLVSNEQIRNILVSRFRKEVNPAILKMTEVPEGAEIIFQENMRFPVVTFKNIYIFPGIPEYIRKKFTAIKERFRSSAFFLTRIFLNTHETDIAGTLNSVISKNNGVVFGSYPVTEGSDYRIMITAESRSEELLQKAVREFVQLLPKDIITGIE